MKVYSRNHIYRYVPNYLNNRQLPAEEQIVIKLRCIAAPDDDQYNRECYAASRTYSADKAQELNEARLKKLYVEKFCGVEGLDIDGMEGKPLDFDTFYNEAPPELVADIVRAMRSGEALTAGEQKNYVPGSGGL